MYSMKLVNDINAFIKDRYHTETRFTDKGEYAILSYTLPVLWDGKELGSFRSNIYIRDIFIDVILFVIPEIVEEQRRNAGEYLHLVNSHLVDGNFDLDSSNGEVFFRNSTCIDGIQPSNQILWQLIQTTLFYAYRYKAPLLKLLAGELTAEEAFLEGKTRNLEKD